MGSSSYNADDMVTRSTLRSNTAKSKGISYTSATFAFDHDIKTGKTKAAVHPSLKPTNAMRESRDSVEHPITVPIGVILDTTGSMAEVPVQIQAALTKLMGALLNDKASGKKYLGDGYPAILVGAVDDYDAQGYYDGHEGSLQVGQFESGIEIDDNLSNIWLTRNGGGTYSESYDLALYFFARHTVHDHWEKRGRKGYLFIIGDEHTYKTTTKEVIQTIFGEAAQADVKVEDILNEVKERYHVFFVIPNMTSHYGDPRLAEDWVKLLGQQNVLKLEDPNQICECIVGAVAICEENVGIDDLTADLGAGSYTNALVPLSKTAGAGGNGGGAVSRYNADKLPAIAGATSGGGTDRL